MKDRRKYMKKNEIANQKIQNHMDITIDQKNYQKDNRDNCG